MLSLDVNMQKLYGEFLVSTLIGIKPHQCIKGITWFIFGVFTPRLKWSKYYARYALSKYQQPFQALVATTKKNCFNPSASNSHKVPWKPPPSGVFKLNVDATVERTTTTTGLGAIIQDCSGLVVAAFSKKLLGSFDPHEMEALAMFHEDNNRRSRAQWWRFRTMPVSLVPAPQDPQNLGDKEAASRVNMDSEERDETNDEEYEENQEGYDAYDDGSYTELLALRQKEADHEAELAA
uniref:RNase H type-1 domain-containing protein n=1 Tax=Cannabis sativa TaxID=3483 RepID=A0A803QDP6_CANSA